MSRFGSPSSGDWGDRPHEYHPREGRGFAGPDAGDPGDGTRWGGGARGFAQPGAGEPVAGTRWGEESQPRTGGRRMRNALLAGLLLVIVAPLLVLLGLALSTGSWGVGESYESHLERGRTLSHAEQLDEAVREFKRAIELNPQGAEAMDALGTVYLETGDYPACEQMARQGLSVAPYSTSLHVLLGLARSSQGANDEGAEEYRKAIAIDPQCASAHRNLGLYYVDIENYPRAIEELETYLQLEPGGEEADKLRESVERLKAGQAQGI